MCMYIGWNAITDRKEIPVLYMSRCGSFLRSSQFPYIGVLSAESTRDDIHPPTSIVLSYLTVMTLNQLIKGQVARITQIKGEDAISIRLMEMGLIDGEQIQLLGKAPLGDPLEYAVRGYRLSLRLNEAKCVEVEIV